MSFVVFGYTNAAVAQSESTSTPSEQPAVVDTPPPPESVILPPPHDALVQDRPLHLLFRSQTEGVSFHLRLGATYPDIIAGAASFGLYYHVTGYPPYSADVAPGYAPICEAPCVATLFPGKHHIALALPEGQPLDARAAVDITTESVIEGRYVDKSRMRSAGATIFFVGMIAGMLMMFAAADYSDFRRSNYAVFFTGLGLLSVGFIVGPPLMTRRDEAYIDVYPLDQ